mmetsp:Transcript_70778/g.133711  ORF Transcript_70778/g.133711 Transcript_70778/m.133711 type:complete len:205 (-) Transcript_70778:79-693(-)
MMSLNGLTRTSVLLLFLFGCLWTASADEENGIPSELDEFTPNPEQEGLFTPEGMEELVEASKAWLGAEKQESLEDLKTAGEAVVKGVRAAADFSHDLFAGMRIFATTWDKAMQLTDEAEQTKALKKAVGLRSKFSKALGKLAPKIVNLRMVRMKEAEARKKAMEAQKAAEEAKKAKEEEAEMDDMDDDLSDGKEGDADLDDDEF